MKRDGAPTKREIELGRARNAGYHADARTYTRAIIERRTASAAALRAAYRQGEAIRAQGVPCNCPDCLSTRPATGTPPPAPPGRARAPTKAITILTGPISL